jgi:hypothetical protein
VPISGVKSLSIKRTGLKTIVGGVEIKNRKMLGLHLLFFDNMG